MRDGVRTCQEHRVRVGIYDRDYIRDDSNSQGRSSGGKTPGVGSVRVWSVNTWLIVINIAVFVLNNFVFQSVQWPVQLEQRFVSGTTAQQAEQAIPDRTRLSPRSDGTFIYPLSVVQSDPLGRSFKVDVGFERFRPMAIIEAFGHFSTGKFWSDGQVWRLISFQFLHANLWHLVFNMMGLWFVGGLVEQYLGRRRYAAFYLTCGVFGALAYLLLNLLGYLVGSAGVGRVPFLLFEDAYTPLIGASAGVFGVLMAAAFIAPDAIVDVLMILPMRLQTAVYIFLALAIVNLWQGGQNAGGDAAHVGGALVGAYLIRRPHLLRDILAALWLHRGRGESGRAARPQPPPRDERDAVERILAKISADGIESLSESERAVLRRAARP
jgi:membrane associated rhomboid family serine protease